MRGTFGWIVLTAVLMSGSTPLPAAQDGEKETKPRFVELPRIPAYRLSKDKYLLWRSKVDEEYAQFIRDLRKVPVVESRGTPTSLIITKYLKREARAYDSDTCYAESDWLTEGQLTTLGSLVHRVADHMESILGHATARKTRQVVLRTKEDYLTLVDLWADSELRKKHARKVAATTIQGHRIGYRQDVGGVLKVAIADTCTIRNPPALWYHRALTEAMHVYLSALLVNEYTLFISLDVTSPESRMAYDVERLFALARHHFSKKNRVPLADILRSELNSVTEEKLAVLVSLVDFLMRYKRGKWGDFVRVLQRESFDNNVIKGPFARYQALVTAVNTGFNYEVADLEKGLAEFVLSNYLTQAQLADALNIHGKCSRSTYNSFLKACKKRQAGDLSAGIGNPFYERVVELIEKELEKKRVPF